jgi:hypothetical protein
MELKFLSGESGGSVYLRLFDYIRGYGSSRPHLADGEYGRVTTSD